MVGLCEIGGGYLVWLWLREGKPMVYALLEGIILFLYGIIPTFQPAHLGRLYAAYGGVFIVLSIIWGWKVDQIAPDRFGRLFFGERFDHHVLASKLTCRNPFV